MRVLFLTKLDFWKTTNTGGKMISKRNYEMLKKTYGEEHLYYCGIGDDMCKYDDGKRYSVPVARTIFTDYGNYFFCRYGYGKKAEKKVLEFINKVNPEIIFFDGSWMGNLLKKINCRFTIVFFHNVEANVILKSINKNGVFRPQRIFRYWCIKKNEKFVAKNANYRICMNQRDSGVLRRFYNLCVDFYLPTTIIDSYDGKKNVKMEEKEHTVLFVGANFAPNVRGLDWFIINVLPYIDCKLIIVGSGMEGYRPPVEDNKTTIIGEVENLAEYYINASAVICPIFLGDGMKTKTAEAMMYGKTIFATNEALEGYEVDDVKNIYKCNSDKEFINRINDYFTKGEKKLFNENIREKFVQKYEFNSKYIEFYKWILENGLI